jgi:hypothetical protein
MLKKIYKIVGKLIYYFILAFLDYRKKTVMDVEVSHRQTLLWLPTDVNPLGFMPNLSMRSVGDNSIGRNDVHGLTTAFPKNLSNRYTTSYGCHDLLERVNRH